MKVATAIFHHERNDLTDAVLQQLIKVPNIFVHDDGSSKTYNTPNGLKNDHLINILFVRDRGGYIKAVNRVMNHLAEQGFDAVWTLNNDIDLGSFGAPMLDALVHALENSPSMAAVTPAVDPNPHPDMRPDQNKDFRNVPFIDWVCPLVRMTAWNEVGGFDRNLKGYGCDIQFCYDARQLKWNFGVIPNQKVFHQMGATCKSVDPLGHDDLEFMTSYLKTKYNVTDVWTLTR